MFLTSIYILEYRLDLFATIIVVQYMFLQQLDLIKKILHM